MSRADLIEQAYYYSNILIDSFNREDRIEYIQTVIDTDYNYFQSLFTRYGFSLDIENPEESIIDFLEESDEDILLNFCKDAITMRLDIINDKGLVEYCEGFTQVIG